MKKVKSLFIILPLLAIALVIGGFYWWKTSLSPVSSDKTAVRFVIQKGWGATQIGNKLAEKNLIKSALAFKIFVQISGKSSKIQAGEYSFSPSSSLPALVEKLLKGPDLLWVTIPEGYRLEEVARKFATDLEKEDAEGFVEEFTTKAKGKEGFLFPDSYLFPKDATVDKIISMMSSTFNSKTADLVDKVPSGMTLSQVVTLASLIERETKTDAERPMVAGILYNRIEGDWPLQVDASVQYAVTSSKLKVQDLKLGDFWQPLVKADLEIASPYNTYKYQGLPPAPICNPGMSSIEAAFSPEGNNYWFYLHDADGQIHYAETIEEHNANIAKYLGK